MRSALWRTTIAILATTSLALSMHSTSHAAGTAAFDSLGGNILGTPATVSFAPNRLDTFVVGTDQALYHKYFNGAWGPS